MSSKATEFVVTTPEALSHLIGRLRATLREKGYVRGKINTSRKRSLDQSALYYAWVAQVHVERCEESLVDVRNFCKLSFFVPILVNDNEEFAEVFCSTIAKLPHDEQLKAMSLIDVTSVCTVKQMGRGMEAMQMHYSALATDSVLLESSEKV